eukprot:SAG11_NODE_25524_length_357_cov_6.767442_1_plen_90_part_10
MALQLTHNSTKIEPQVTCTCRHFPQKNSKYSSVGSCACAAAERKVQKYGPGAERQQFRFVPLACETYGAPAEELVEFVRDLSSHADAEGV